MDRSSHRGCSVKKGVLRNFAKFTGKHLCQSLFFNKVAGRLQEHLFYRTPPDDCFCMEYDQGDTCCRPTLHAAGVSDSGRNQMSLILGTFS